MRNQAILYEKPEKDIERKQLVGTSLYDLQGRMVCKETRGLLIIKQGNAVKKVLK